MASMIESWIRARFSEGKGVVVYLRGHAECWAFNPASRIECGHLFGPRSVVSLEDVSAACEEEDEGAE